MRDSDATQRETWANGAAYEDYVGRWSRLAARSFLEWLAVPGGGRWLDVGCGTGALTQAILEFAAPSGVKGVDRSEAYAAFAREQIPDERAQFEVGDAQALPVETGEYDAVVSGLMLNFAPEPSRVAAEIARAAKPGGVVAAYVWDYADKMQMMRHFWDAATALNPTAETLDEGRRFSVCQPEPLRELFRGAGLRQIDVQSLEIATHFQDFDDYWTPFLGGQGSAPSYVQTLSAERRDALRECIRAVLPFAVDGSIPLVARAWAVRGLR